MEKCVKNAMLAILARLYADLQDYADDTRRDLATAILFRLTSTNVDGRADSVEAFGSRNHDLVEKEAFRLMASDCDLREMTIQTQRFLYVGRKAHSLHSRARALLDNSFYQLYQFEYPVIAPAAFYQLVGDFYRKLAR